MKDIVHTKLFDYKRSLLVVDGKIKMQKVFAYLGNILPRYFTVSVPFLGSKTNIEVP